MGEARLAELLAEQISRLPYHRQREWVARHLPPKGASKPNPSRLLDDVEAFYAESRAGTFVSWADDGGWDGGAGDEEPEELKEWIEIFTDLMKGGPGPHQGRPTRRRPARICPPAGAAERGS